MGEMIGMTDRRAFIDAIRATPEDDAPRGVFADWLDEYGDREYDARWAAFIRIQLKMAAAEGQAKAFHNTKSKDLFLGYRYFGTLPGALIDSYIANTHSETLISYPHWSRGFLETPHFTAADWLTHAAAILAEHPVRELTLTTMPEAGLADGRVRLGAGGPFYITRARAEDAPAGQRRLVEWAFAQEWPGLTVHLPTQRQDRDAYIAVGRIDPGQMVYSVGDLADRRVSASPPNVQGRLNILAGAAGQPIHVPGSDQDYFEDGDYVPVRRQPEPRAFIDALRQDPLFDGVTEMRLLPDTDRSTYEHHVLDQSGAMVARFPEPPPGLVRICSANLLPWVGTFNGHRWRLLAGRCDCGIGYHTPPALV